MTKQLKTLEELTPRIGGSKMDVIYISELKQEAIKWVKELQKQQFGGEFCLECRTKECTNRQEHNDYFLFEIPEMSDISGTIQFIKCFFNLAEEEIK